MFTGLVQEIGKVVSVTGSTVIKITVSSYEIVKDIKLGDSVAVNGVCLTATSFTDNQITFDAVPETISRSNLKLLKPGDLINLENSLKVGQSIGGHFVQGHVDCLGEIVSVVKLAESELIKIGVPSSALMQIVEKGSIAVDGISLTVANVDSNSFTLAVIPHTLRMTTLKDKKAGDKVNIETDILGKYIEKFMNNKSNTSLTMDKLRDSGFV